MGQATVDLPDPSETTPASQKDADDLLAQMAGDEIDRLLAEAEVEAPKQPNPPPASVAIRPLPELSPAADSTAAIPPVNEEYAVPSEDELADLFKEMTAGEAVTGNTPAPASPAPIAEAPIAKQPVNELPLKTSARVEPVVKTPPPAVEGPPAPPLADPMQVARELGDALAHGSHDSLPPVAAAEKAPAGREVETSHAEKSALANVVEAFDTAPALPPDAHEPRPLPFFLWPLAWLNAPFNALPAPLRDLLGKVAILTFLNAVAVFVYILFFRKHG